MPQLPGNIEGAKEVPIATMGSTVTEFEAATNQMHEEAMSERRLRDAVEGVEPTSSRPPSPPETRSPTPRVSIAPCPARLTPLVPPVNYGAVEKHTIFRSGFPQDRNVEFLEGLGLNGMITLVEEEMKPEVAKFIDMYGVNHASIPIKANKEGEIRATLDSLCEAVLYLLNPINHPVYIHCNRGKHRTGCVIACLRKCQAWPIDEILAEYETYAGDKARPEDKQLIRGFDPACVFKYAKSQHMLGNWPIIPRKDSVMNCDPVDVFDLASWLPAHNTALIPTEADDDETDDEDGLMIAKRVLTANYIAQQAEQNPTAADIDMMEKEEEMQDENAMHVEEINRIDPQLKDEHDRAGDDRVARYDWSNGSPTRETSENVAYASSTTQPLSVSPVRARAAA